MTATVALGALLAALSLAAAAHGFVIGCSFNLKNGTMPTPSPLFLKPYGPLNVSGYLEPDSNGQITMFAGEEVLLACPGTTLYALKVSEATATCVSGSTFAVGAGQYALQDLKCSVQPKHAAVRTGNSCGSPSRQATELRIGHNTTRGFIELIRVCFDEQRLEALFASSTVVASIGGAETNVDRPAFISAGYFGTVDPNKHYLRDGQRDAFAQLLGSTEEADKYISSTSDYYLARGHLVAKADFVFAQPQRATFYYVNAAPQWQTFNGGNWERLESSVRSLADKRSLDLLVITGTFGQITLPDVAGKPTNMSINADGRLPVPAVYWKVVYDASSRAGVAFVGMNNPYTTLAENSNLVLCPDVCSSIGWVSWAPQDVRQGEGYCCQVDDLRASVPFVPQLDVQQLLV